MPTTMPIFKYSLEKHLYLLLNETSERDCQLHFQSFNSLCNLMAAGAHLSPKVLCKIMGPSKRPLKQEQAQKQNKNPTKS